MELACVIVAAGVSNRISGALPKQYRMIVGQSVLERSIRAILVDNRVEGVVCVINAKHLELYETCAAAIKDRRLLPPTLGGSSRSESARNGLTSLQSKAPSHVLIHDAARPFLSAMVLDRVINALGGSDAVMPILPVTDTIWRQTPPSLVLVDRTDLWRAQTPQGFRYDAIVDAYAKYAATATDDIAVALAAKLQVSLVDGSEHNFKITTDEDFIRVQRNVSVDVRTGTGFDVHAFCPGASVTLCGVKIPFGFGLLGHSDADVAMHAITDAIFGALAEGDIGTWFPPSDNKWKNAGSKIFLQKAVDLCSVKSLGISHIDCTIICELPKISGHALEMRRSISAICGLDISRVSIKATTTERLGFTGRGEGIAAMASATLVSK